MDLKSNVGTLQGRRIHPSLHFEEDLACVCIVDANNDRFIITSNKEAIRLSALDKKTFSIKPIEYSGIYLRWSIEDMEQWRVGDPAPSIGDTVQYIQEVIEYYVQLRRAEESVLIACWIVATYVYLLFPAFPRLHLLGEKESGKSKLLELIAHMAFNGLLRLNPTPAMLFRLIGPLRPTLCLDEVESLAGEDYKQMLSIINSGYKQGGVVDRVGGKDFEKISSFPVYAPLALAGIAGLNPTTESRAITLLMERGGDERVNREVLAEEPYFQDIRNACYRSALTDFQLVREEARNLQIPEWLSGRHRELYKPLLTIASLAEKDVDCSFSQNILTLAEQELGDRSKHSIENETILEGLQVALGQHDEVTVRPRNIAWGVSQKLDRKISPEKVGTALHRLGFPRERVSKGTLYHVTREKLESVQGVPTTG